MFDGVAGWCCVDYCPCFGVKLKDTDRVCLRGFQTEAEHGGRGGTRGTVVANNKTPVIPVTSISEASAAYRVLFLVPGRAANLLISFLDFVRQIHARARRSRGTLVEHVL